MLIKAKKVIYKSVWDAYSSTRRKPQVSTLHEQSVYDYQGRPDIEFIRRSDEPAYIEPTWGYVITKAGVILEDSLRPNFVHDKAAWRVALPSPVAFATHTHIKPSKVVHFPQAISLRHLWEWNYYHFHLDVLGKLSLLDDMGVDRSAPLVIGRYAMELPFVRQCIERGALGKRPWFIQDQTYVLADNVFYCRTRQPYGKRVDHFVREMGLPDPDPSREERVFLIRLSQVARHILNADEVTNVLADYGFRMVATEGMTIAEQTDLFMHTRYLVGIHGAGLTNILYRRHSPLGMIELHANNYLTGDYREICTQFNNRWYHLGGAPDDQPAQGASFHIDIGQLRAKVEAMLAGAPSDPLFVTL